MTIGRDFITMGLGLAERALIDLMARDDLQLRPEKMLRTRRARASGRLKQIERIVRHLIFLMALGLHIAFAPPKRRGDAKVQPLPDGVELVTFPGAADRNFTLMPQAVCPFMEGPAPERARVLLPPGPVSTAKLLSRIRAVWRVMQAPDGYAKRLARSIQRIRAKGEPRPMAFATEKAYRLTPELGALATMLPSLLNRKFEESWESSG